MSATSDAAALVSTAISALSTAKDDGGTPSFDLIHAGLWAFAHSPYVEAMRAEPPPRGRLAEFGELDPCALTLVTSSDEGRAALAHDLEAARPRDDGPDAARPRSVGPQVTPPPPPPELAPTLTLTSDELVAAVRFVAKQAPHLAVALVWSVATNPSAVFNLCELTNKIKPAQLEDLVSLDPALSAAVWSSGPAYVRLKRHLEASAGEHPPPPSTDEDVVEDLAAVEALAARVHRVATESPELLPALLTQLCDRAPSRLALRTHRPRPAETLALRAFELGLDVDSILPSPDSTT